MFIVTTQEEFECENIVGIFKPDEEVAAVRLAIKKYHEDDELSIVVYSANFQTETEKTVLSAEYYLDKVFGDGLEIEVHVSFKQ